VQPFEAQWLPCVPPALALEGFTFGPHSVGLFMDQTAVLFVHSTNLFVFVVEKQCVLYELGTEFSEIFR
jgi:hypothetical protein